MVCVVSMRASRPQPVPLVALRLKVEAVTSTAGRRPTLLFLVLIGGTTADEVVLPPERGAGDEVLLPLRVRRG